MRLLSQQCLKLTDGTYGSAHGLLQLYFICTDPKREAIYIPVQNSTAVLVQETATVFAEALVKVSIQTLL